MQNDTSDKSALALAIESRARKAHEFEVQGFFGLGGQPIHKVGFRVNTKAEEDKALVTAYLTVNQLTEGAEQAREDPDLVQDVKLIHALYSACRRAESGDGERKYSLPAFPSPNWMRDNLTTDQIAVLINLYNGVRIAEGPLKVTITFEEVEEVAELCAENSRSDVPELVLAPRSREWLIQAFALLAMRWRELHGLASEREHDGDVDRTSEASGEDEEASGDDVPSGAEGSTE